MKILKIRENVWIYIRNSQWNIHLLNLLIKFSKKFHFVSFSQFYGPAHNAIVFLKCAPLDSLRNLVRMVWFDQDSGWTWTRECVMEPENLPLARTPCFIYHLSVILYVRNPSLYRAPENKTIFLQHFSRLQGIPPSN